MSKSPINFLTSLSMQKYDNFVVLPTECLAPINAYGVGCPKTGTFSIHWYAATWYDELQQKNKEKAIRSSRYLLSRMSKKG